MKETWVSNALERLPDTGSCPACGATLQDVVCGRCALDLSGQRGLDLHNASLAAERAIRERQRILDEMRAEQTAVAGTSAAELARQADSRTRTTSPTDEDRPLRRPAPAVTASAPVTAPTATPPAAPHRTVALQPILAGAGAALLAVSTVVFVFFTLADQLVLRTAATSLVTVASVVTAALMRRAGLRSSAEAVAALAAALTWACAELGLQAGLLGGIEPSLARAVLLTLLAPTLVALGDRLKVRSWAAAGTVAAPLVPLLVAAGLSDVVLPAWVWILALVAAGLVAHTGRTVQRRTGERLGVTLRWESKVLGAVRTLAIPAALVATTTLPRLGPLSALAWVAVWWTLVSVGALVLGHTLRVRAWATTGLVMAPFAALPAVLALPADAIARPWTVGVGALVVAVATLGGPVVARVTGPRVGSVLRVELRLLEVVQALAVTVAVVAALLVPPVAVLTTVPGDPATALLLAVAAVVAAVLRRGTHRRWWTFTAGALGAVAAVFLAAQAGPALLWALPAAAGVAWAVLATTLTVLVTTRARGLVPAARTRADLLLAAWLVAVLAAVPAVLSASARAFDVLIRGLEFSPTPWLGREPLGNPFDLPEVHDAILLGFAVLTLLLLAGSRLGIAVGLSVGMAPDQAAPVVRVARAVAPWVTVGLAGAATLHPRLHVSASLALLAVLSAVLLAATSDPERAWRGLRPVVTVARSGLDGLRRASGATTRLGGSPMRPEEGRSWRPAALTGACVALGLLALGSWQTRPTVLAATVVAVPLVLAARAALPRPVLPVLVGGAYAYALVVGGVWLGWLGFGWVAAVCTVSAAASLTAVAVTTGSKAGRGEWFAVLGVTAVPFALGVLTVISDRTWWSAGAAVAMLLLELVLLLTRRPGLAPAVRVMAAGLVLPTASVAIVSAGAMLLRISGSPVLLPVIAAAVAVVAGGAPRVAGYLAGRVPDGGTVGTRVRGVLELSTVVTGTIAVALAYGRPSAGPDVAVAVLLLLAVGAGVVAREPDRTGIWWLTGLLGTAAAWTALAAGGIRLVEAYTLPPAIGAVLVGTLLARRAARLAGAGAVAAGTREGHGTPSPGTRGHGWRLATAGAVLALVPSDLTLALASGPGDPRSRILLVTGVVLTLAIVLLRRWPAVSTGWAARARALLAGAALLVSAGLTVESLHVAAYPYGAPGERFVTGLGWAVAAAVIAFVAVTGARPGTPSARLRRMVDAGGRVPALLFLTAGAVANAEPHWGAIATLWTLEVALLVLLVLAARRLLRGLSSGVPSWFVWACALAAAIAAWSPRELRVEVFSVPLGVGLVVAGCFALGEWQARTTVSGPGSARVPQRTLGSWPVGWTGSWALLGPGILALLGPSVLATFTDPQTWRAVLVIGIALAGVLVGSRRGLASPFLLGVWVLPIEVLIVFLTQLGTEISAVPWMLTLAAAGGVLLIIATLDERRTEGYGGAAAYLRDLR